MRPILWSALTLALLWTGCTQNGPFLAETDLFCRRTADSWVGAPTGKTHDLIEHYYHPDAKADAEDVFEACKRRERDALEHPDHY